MANLRPACVLFFPSWEFPFIFSEQSRERKRHKEEKGLSFPLLRVSSQEYTTTTAGTGFTHKERLGDCLSARTRPRVKAGRARSSRGDEEALTMAEISHGEEEKAQAPRLSPPLLVRRGTRGMRQTALPRKKPALSGMQFPLMASSVRSVKGTFFSPRRLIICLGILNSILSHLICGRNV